MLNLCRRGIGGGRKAKTETSDMPTTSTKSCVGARALEHFAFFVVLFLASGTAITANAGNCLIQGSKKIGDCSNVHVGGGKPLVVRESGSFSGNYSHVRIKKGVVASISGNADDVVVESNATLDLSGNCDSVLVESGATLYLSGNSGDVSVRGIAEINGNADWITAHKGSRVTINGIVGGVKGSGTIVKNKGAIVSGVLVK
jgi:hypothetical protein